MHPRTTLVLLAELLSAAPHRITGTPEADAARAWIVKQLTDLGLAPIEEAFTYRVPGAVSRFATLLNAWMMPLLGWFAVPLGPWVGMAAIAALNAFDFGLAPRIGRSAYRTGSNIVTGITRPWSEVLAARRPTVIITAHIDTAHPEPIWMRRLLSQNENAFSLAAIGLLLLLLFWIAVAVAGLWPGGALLVAALHQAWAGVGRWIVVALCLPIAVLTSVWLSAWWFERGLVNPGADDNGSGVAVALQLAADLAPVTHAAGMEAAVLLVDAEEVGLRGTHDFVKRNGPALDPALTTIVNLDAVGRGAALISVSGQGLFQQRRADTALLETWAEVSARHAAAQATVWFTFFSAGTDQAAWLARGFRRTLSISHGNLVSRRLPALVYRVFGIRADPVELAWDHLHSPADDLSGISAEALNATQAAVIDLVRALGQRASGP